MKNLLRVLVVCTVIYPLSCAKSYKRRKSNNADPIDVQFRYPLADLDEVPVASHIFAKVGPIPSPVEEGFRIGLTERSGAEVLGVSQIQALDDHSYVFKFIPEDRLDRGTEYQATLYAPHSKLGTWRFKTEKGKYADGFSLIKMYPRHGPREKFMDSSTIRLTFSRGLDENSAVSSVYLEDSQGVKVPAITLVQGRRLSLDPLHDLVPGKTYKLILTENLKSVFGDRIPETSIDLIPEESGKPLMMAMNLGESGAASFLSGLESGIGELSSTLAGTLRIRAQGALQGELASMKKHPRVTPLVIRKGARLEADSQDVKLGGEVHTGLSTGKIRLTLLSDATGFLFPRSNASQAGGLEVLIYVDLAIDVEDAKVQKMLGGEVLHTMLMGIVRIEGRKIFVDIESDFSVSLMGKEDAKVHLANHVESLTEPSYVEVTPDSPFVVVQEPFVHQGQGGSTALSFSEALDLRSLSSLHLQGPESSELEFHRDGSQLLLSGLGFEKDQIYELDLSGVRSLSGKYIGDNLLIVRGEKPEKPHFEEPMILAIQPGESCVLYGGDWRTGGQTAGKCQPYQTSAIDFQDEAEVFPLFEHGVNQPLTVVFSRLMDESSFIVAKSCDDKSASIGLFYYKFDKEKGLQECQGSLDVRLEFRGRRLKIYPALGLEKGPLYTLNLKGRLSGSSGCQSGQICSLSRLPLRSNGASFVEDLADAEDLVIPFRATKGTRDILIEAENYSENNQVEIRLDPDRWPGFTNGKEGILSSLQLVSGDPTILKPKGALVGSLLSVRDGRARLQVLSSTLTMGSMVMRARVLDNSAPALNFTIDSGAILVRVVGEPILSMSSHQDTKGMFVRGKVEALMDAPDLKVSPDIIKVETDLHSKRVTMDVEGWASFNENGLLETVLSNPKAIKITVTATLGEKLTDIFLEIPARSLKMDMMTQR